MSDSSNAKRPSGRKGGAIFPRINLEDAVDYAKKLVGKTHIGPQPATTILPGVFGSSTDRGQIRASALKQYGLMEGKSDAYQATDLAKAVASAPPEELPIHLRNACLRPKVFELLFNTFHGDTVSTAKLKQQAAIAKVHPDETQNCVDTFVASAVFAGIATTTGDNVSLISASSLTEVPGADSHDANEAEVSDDGVRADDSPAVEDASTLQDESFTASNEVQRSQSSAVGSGSARSIIRVNLNVDSSLDVDKLERQLELLRKYGAL